METNHLQNRQERSSLDHSSSMRMALVKVSILTGKTKLDELQIRELTKYLDDYFPKVTPVDVVRAVELCTQDKLDEPSDTIKFVNAISLSRVLNSYKRFLISRKPLSRQLAKENPISEKELRDRNWKAVITLFNQAKQNTIFPHQWHYSATKILVREKVILFKNEKIYGHDGNGYVELGSVEQVRQQATENIERRDLVPGMNARWANGKVQEMIRQVVASNITDGDLKNQVRWESLKLTLKLYFQYLLENSIELKTIKTALHESTGNSSK